MGILDDPLDPSAIEILRRSVVMLTPGQAANIDRDHALALLDELQRLQGDRRAIADELRRLLDRVITTDHHPSRGPGHRT